MKVTKEKAEENRRHVIETSSRLFREKGFDGVGVSTLMQAAGLTHGGFYKQFASKDDLITQATKAALDQAVQQLSALVEDDKHTALAQAVGLYLSDQHRDGVGTGCAFAALGPDVARHGPAARDVMERGVEDHLALLAPLMDDKEGSPAREQAMVAMATMVGVLVLARTVESQALSSAVLDAAAKAILKTPT